jgi:hypothetical protein
MRGHPSHSAHVLALTLLVSWPSFASSVDPDAEFAFSAPVSDRQVIVDLVSAALKPLGFEAGPVTSIRPNGFFRITYSTSDGADVFLRGPLACATVSIYTSREGIIGDEAASQARQVQDTLVTHLRAAADGDLLLFRAVANEPCVHAL